MSSVLSTLAATRQPKSLPASLSAVRASARATPATVSDGVGVPTLHHTVVEFANLDHGATAPALVGVAEAAERILRTYGSVHRGAGYASRLTTGWFEEARSEVAHFVGLGEDSHVVFTRNTTDALALLAHVLPDNAQVFVFESVHHAALLPWPAERTTRLSVPSSPEAAIATVDAALSRFRATSDAPALVVITGACNVTGEIWPIGELAAVARSHGARSVVDAAQLAPHRVIDIDAWGVDYVAFSGHKMYAPYGAGVLAGRADWLDAADPYLPAGGASKRVTTDDVEWSEGPARHEGGTPNAVGAIALAAAAAKLRAHSHAIENHEHRVHGIIRDGLSALPGVKILHVLGSDEEPVDGVGVTTFTVDGYDPTLVAQVLADEHGIAVRDGRFCAHLLCDERLGKGATAVRASIGLATTVEHAHRLVAAVRSLVERGPAFEYVHTPGIGWAPVGDERDLSEPRPW